MDLCGACAATLSSWLDDDPAATDDPAEGLGSKVAVLESELNSALACGLEQAAIVREIASRLVGLEGAMGLALGTLNQTIVQAGRVVEVLAGLHSRLADLENGEGFGFEPDPDDDGPEPGPLRFASPARRAMATRN